MIELRPAKYLLGRLVPMDNNDKIPLFNLGSGTYDNTKFLRGDGTWAVPSGGGGSYVPYTGATADVNLGEYGLSTGWVQIDTTPTTYTPGVGKLGWSTSDGTLEFQLLGGNVTLQIGQEQVARVVNKTDPLIDLLEANYQVVKITGAQGNRLKVALAQANNDANSAETLGVVTENILGNQEGFITTSGLVKSINTTGSLQGETWLDGDMLYLSGTIAGQMTKVKPSAPIHTVILGYVVRAHATQGQIYVKVDNGYELGELHDVNTTISKTTPIDADSVLLQDTADNNLWKKLSWSNLKATLKTYFDVLYQNKITLTTAGTSGAATLVGDTLNIPQYSGGGGSIPPQTDVFTSSGVWTKPAGAVYHEIYVVSGAGGGGSGRRGAASSYRGGGGGGASGVLSSVKINSTALGSTENVWIGAGGAGASAVNVNDNNGSQGTAGSVSLFGGPGTIAGSIVSTGTSPGGVGGSTAQGGSSNTSSYMFGLALATNEITSPTSVPSASPLTANLNYRWLCYGGGGGGIQANNVRSGGAGMRVVGGNTSQIIYNKPAVSSTGAVGLDGDFYLDTIFSPFCALGPSGGSSGDVAGTTAGGNGGNGSTGSGGGGGGASTNGANSGAGGRGGDGFCMIITYFQ